MKKIKDLSKYSLPMRIMHNFSAILFLITLIFGILLEKKVINGQYFYLHKSLGITVFILVIIRIIIKLNTKNIPETYFSKEIEWILAKFVSYGLYLCLLLMPLSGYLMSAFYGGKSGSINFFNIFKIPFFNEKNQILSGFFNSAHEYITYFSIFLIFLHIIGSFKHLIVEKDNIFKKMI